MLNRPGLCFQPHARLLAERLQAALLAAHPAAGHAGRGRAARQSSRPALREVAEVLVRWTLDGQPFGQGAIAAAAGLSRPTVIHYLEVWTRAGLVVRVDDDGRPVAHGATHPAGTAARWRLETRWTPQLVELIPAHWRPRLELAWAALQLDASDELVGRCLRSSPACNGDRALWAWYSHEQHRRQRRTRRERRACQRAAERAERQVQGDQVADVAATLGPAGELDPRNSTPPGTGPSGTCHSGPVGADEWQGLAPRSALAREARAASPPRRTGPSSGQLRRLIEAGLIRTGTEGGDAFAELVLAGDSLGEDDPASLFGAIANLAVRRRRSLRDLIGHYCRTADQVRVDIAGRVRNGDREPVANPAAFAWRMVRYEAGDLPRPPRRGWPQLRSAAAADAVGSGVRGEQLAAGRGVPFAGLEVERSPGESDQEYEERSRRERFLAAYAGDPTRSTR